jgi:hypothetical protein
VEAEWEQSPVFAVGARRHRSPTLEDRLIAHMLAPWLDRELARGLGESRSEAHAARAEQLSGERTRRAVAHMLDRLVDRTAKPRRALPHLVIAPCREQVENALPVIGSIRSRLRSTDPVDARAIAELNTLLRDRDGPCYVPTGPDALKVALRRISDSLDVRA